MVGGLSLGSQTQDTTELKVRSKLGVENVNPLNDLERGEMRIVSRVIPEERNDPTVDGDGRHELITSIEAVPHPLVIGHVIERAVR
jgi:hypothetical protein